MEAEALAGRHGRRGPHEEEEGEGGGCFLSILSFYIVLAQTLCTHNTLQDRKQRTNWLVLPFLVLLILCDFKLVVVSVWRTRPRFRKQV